MAIKFTRNTIEFDNFTLRATPAGFDFNGEALGRLFNSSQHGTSFGYQAGGISAPSTDTTRIERYSFTVDANASTIGNLNAARRDVGGASSRTSGYVLGGYNTPTGFLNSYEKFSFVSNSILTSAYVLNNSNYGIRGISSQTDGYAAGGGFPGVGAGVINNIDKFPFAVDANATDLGDLTIARGFGGTVSSMTHGYYCGGNYSGINTDTIDKFPFAVPAGLMANATDVANLSLANRVNAGVYSFTHGYSVGGSASGALDVVDKFPFAADANATDVANLTTPRDNASGSSSITDGYIAGGAATPGYTSNIEKFSFTSESTKASVGTFSGGTAIYAGTGLQY